MSFVLNNSAKAFSSYSILIGLICVRSFDILYRHTRMTQRTYKDTLKDSILGGCGFNRILYKCEFSQEDLIQLSFHRGRGKVENVFLIEETLKSAKSDHFNKLFD